MTDSKALEKIKKLEGKKKSDGIIKLMHKADTETIVAALEALGNIADEDSNNTIAHYFNNEDKALRIASCEQGIKLGTEYMHTRVRHQLAIEQDADVKKAIQDAFNKHAK